MPPFDPISRVDLIHYLRKAGFSEPRSGGKHQHMKRGKVGVTVSNPHSGDIGKPLLARVLRDAGISREEWGKL
jgi:predicted RNA binding protein YcfA (HicA-like mRNA interferase family)